MSWVLEEGKGDPEAFKRALPYPQDFATVQEYLRWQIRLWRQERTAWNEDHGTL